MRRERGIVWAGDSRRRNEPPTPGTTRKIQRDVPSQGYISRRQGKVPKSYLLGAAGEGRYFGGCVNASKAQGGREEGGGLGRRRGRFLEFCVSPHKTTRGSPDRRSRGH